jgi:hypothetical protein
VAAIVQNDSLKGLKKSIFDARLSDATQEIVRPTVLEPAESGDEDLTTVYIDTQEGAPVTEVPPEPIEEEDVCFRVCVGNLTSASSWFNRALRKNELVESNRNSKDG